MDFLKKWFSGPRFWHMFAILNLVLILIGLVAGNPSTHLAVVMWLSLATAEILTAIDKKRE